MAIDGQERYIRSKTLGTDYTEERLRERISKALWRLLFTGCCILINWDLLLQQTEIYLSIITVK
jgi:hypothetical protein